MAVVEKVMVVVVLALLAASCAEGTGGDVSVTGMGPGDYLVEFTVSGNPLFSERFTVTGT